MYLTREKVAVMGAAGAIGSNLVQILLDSGTANRIAMYDPFAAGLEGAYEEICHCAFPEAAVSWTTDAAEALDGAGYVVSSGGAPRREGMTREDLLRGNCEIAAGLGRDIKQHAPGCRFAVVIFNPADITGLTVLVHSGLQPGRVSTLAALDSTRLQTRLAQHFGVPQHRVTGCATYGGHGEQMAVFRGGTRVDGVALTELLRGATVNGIGLSDEQWAGIVADVRGGGARIIQLRGRSSFQSPAQQTVMMLRGFLGERYDWPCGCYLNRDPFRQVMMAMPCRFGEQGLEPRQPEGDADDLAALDESYRHVAALRDQVIEMGVLPPLGEWQRHNPHL